MAQEQPRLFRQRQQLLNRSIQRACVAAWKIRSRRARVGSEERVADEGGVADHISETVLGVAWRCHRAHQQRANFERFFIVQQSIELTAVAGEARLQTKQGGETFLQSSDTVPDRNLCASPLFQIGGAAEMVGVHMSFQDPIDA